MIINTLPPVYPQVHLARYDKLSVLKQAAQYLHEAVGMDLTQARASLLASAASDSVQLSAQAALVHVTDPDCTTPSVVVLTLRHAVAWTALHQPVTTLIVLRVPQLTSDDALAAMRQHAAAVVQQAAQAGSLAQWQDDPVGLSFLAADILASRIKKTPSLADK